MVISRVGGVGETCAGRGPRWRSESVRVEQDRRLRPVAGLEVCRRPLPARRIVNARAGRQRDMATRWLPAVRRLT